MTTPDTGLRVESREHVLTCTIDRQERRNALTFSVVKALGEILLQADADPEVRAICLTGAGEKAFCSGADLSAELPEEGPAGVARAFADLLTVVAGLGTPLLARVNGHCVAGGMGLMLSCDLAIASNKAKFGTPEVKSGLFPMMIAPLILQHAGPKRTMDLLFTGRLIQADEALAMNLINRVVSSSDLDQVVDATLAAIVANGPAAISLGRKALFKTRDLPFGQAVQTLAAELVKVMNTEDAGEGIAAFLEKRTPFWKNR